MSHCIIPAVVPDTGVTRFVVERVVGFRVLPEDTANKQNVHVKPITI